jgi:hypothetical protein
MITGLLWEFMHCELEADLNNTIRKSTNSSERPTLSKIEKRVKPAVEWKERLKGRSNSRFLRLLIFGFFFEVVAQNEGGKESVAWNSWLKRLEIEIQCLDSTNAFLNRRGKKLSVNLLEINYIFSWFLVGILRPFLIFFVRVVEGKGGRRLAAGQTTAVSQLIG